MIKRTTLMNSMNKHAWFFDGFSSLIMGGSTFRSVCSLLCCQEHLMAKCIAERSTPPANAQFFMAKHLGLLFNDNFAVDIVVEFINGEAGSYLKSKLLSYLASPSYCDFDGQYISLGGHLKVDEELRWFIAGCEEIKRQHRIALSDVATLIGVSPTSLSLACSGRIRPSMHLQFRLMMHLKMADRFEDLCAVLCSMVGGDVGKELEIALLWKHQRALQKYQLEMARKRISA